MNNGSTSSLVLRDDLSRFDVQIALGGFLAGYSNNTLLAYQQNLRQFVSWCSNQDLELFALKRTHIKLFARRLQDRGAARATIGRRLSTVTGFYRYCTEENLVNRNPAANVRRPRQRQESIMSGLDHNELGAFLVQAGLSGARDHVLACLLALNKLRVSGAIGTDVDDLGLQRGHHTLRIVRKGGDTVIVPLAPRTARTVYLAIGERTDCPIFIADAGARLNRHQAARVVRRLAKHAGIAKTSAHTRCATASLRLHSTPGSLCATFKKQDPTRNPGQRCFTTGPDDHSTDTPPTSSPRSLQERHDELGE